MSAVPAEKWIAIALLFGEPNNPDANCWETTKDFTQWREAIRVVFPELEEGKMQMTEALRLYSYYRDWYWTSYLIENAKHLK